MQGGGAGNQAPRVALDSLELMPSQSPAPSCPRGGPRGLGCYEETAPGEPAPTVATPRKAGVPHQLTSPTGLGLLVLYFFLILDPSQSEILSF